MLCFHCFMRATQTRIGKCVYGRVCDNWLPAPPYFLENGSNLASVVPENVQQELTDYSVACVKGMGTVG